MFPPALRTRGTWSQDKPRWQKEHSCPHQKTTPVLSPPTSISLSHRQNDSLSKVKYRHDRRNYSYISRIIFIMRISNKCQNAQWAVLVSNGGFCCHCIFQTEMLVSSYRQLKISSSFLCFVHQIYGDIHLAQIFCIPNSVSLFLTHLFRLLGDISYFIIVMYQIVVTL
jgi:hypothetical protein